jgi:MOSC domain-containing protein YiiM
MSAYLAHIHLSPGGVPKLPVPQAEVSIDGLVGDWQRNRKYHGGPDRAVCLWSAELIEILQAEGHPIGPGTTGENLTITGLDWATLRVGSRLQVGPVQLEVTDYAAPCRTIAHCFKARRYGRISQSSHPGTSRLYARVLQGGELRINDPVVMRAAEPRDL